MKRVKIEVKEKPKEKPKRVGPALKGMRREIRKALTDAVLNIIRTLGIPDKLAAFLIKSFHFHAPVYLLLLFILLPIDIALSLIPPLILMVIFFIYLRGCFITIVEYKLSGDDVNVIDIYILLLGGEINETNRFNYTVTVAAIYFTLISSILYVRKVYL